MNASIRRAAAEDHPALKALWHQVFGDPMDAVEAYFRLRHRDENMLVAILDGELAGMLTMLPLTLVSGAKTYNARYVYAVATAPAFRGQGISTRLLDRAHQAMASGGEAASVLVPASPGLFDFYGKRGYKTAFSLDIVRLRPDELPPFPAGGLFAPAAAREYARLRDKAFQNSGLYARWDEGAVAYAMKTLGPLGGVTRLSLGAGVGCAAWELNGEGVLVKELALMGMDALTALSVLHKALNASAYTVRLPVNSLPGASTLPFGMIRWLIPEPGLTAPQPYLALALD